MVSLSYEDVSERLKQAGVVGAMSGVPVYRKLARAKGKAKRIVINCLESDPYSAHISRLVTDNAEEIVNGAKILMHAVCVKRSVIAIEENRTEAIRALRNAVYDKTLVSTALFKPKYPAGNELLTVNAIYGREVRSGRTPEESGYLVLSAETLLNVFNAFAYGTPQTRKVVTVSGNAVSKKKILRVRNGTSADEIFGQLRRLRRAAGRGDRGRHYARTGSRAGRMRHPLDQRTRRAAEEAARRRRGLHPLRALRARLSDAPRAAQAGLPVEGRADRGLSRHRAGRLHRMRLLRVRLFRQGESAAPHPRRQGAGPPAGIAAGRGGANAARRTAGKRAAAETPPAAEAGKREESDGEPNG